MAEVLTRNLKDGAQGKPWACHNCRRRKVKCDYRKPTCSRCEKADITCLGYQRTTKFVLRTPEDLSSSMPLVVKRNNLNRLAPIESVDEHLLYLQSQVQAPTDPPIQFRLRALGLLKKLYLPQPSQADIIKSSIFSWLPTICELGGASRALNHSLLAFCVIQVAITKTGRAGVDEALQAYNDALQKLQLELDEDGAGQRDEILASISVLSTCEIFVCPIDNAWHAHAQGLSKILSIRSATNSSTPIWRSFCMRIRVVLLIEALVNRSSHSITTSQYPQLNFTSDERESIHGLIDVAGEVPFLFERSEKLIASRNTMQGQWSGDLFMAFLSMIEKLHEHHQQFSSGKAKPLYWAEPSSVENPADDPYGCKLFPFALQFNSLETATQMILWWGIILQVLFTMLDLYDHFYNSSMLSMPSGNPKFGFLVPPEPPWNSRFPTINSVREEADKLARYLCQSVEYCYKVENGTIGPQMTTYAQWVLKLYFGRFNYEREISWCLNVKNMRGPGFRNGIELMRFQDRRHQASPT